MGLHNRCAVRRGGCAMINALSLLPSPYLFSLACACALSRSRSFSFLPLLLPLPAPYPSLSFHPLSIYLCAAVVRRQSFGSNCTRMLTCARSLSISLLFDIHKASFQSAAFQMEQLYGPDHPEVQDARKQMERAKELQLDRSITFTSGTTTTTTSIGTWAEQEETSMDGPATNNADFDSNV